MLSILLVLSLGIMLGNFKLLSLVILALFGVLWMGARSMTWSLLGFGWGGDYLSLLLLLLSFLIVYFMLLSSNRIWEEGDSFKIYLGLMIGMLLILCLIFFSLNILWFFIWFEVILIPLFFLILGWGQQYERFESGLYLVFYTLFGSLPLLVVLIFWGNELVLVLPLLSLEEVKSFGLGSGLFLVAFLMKLPMYFLHYWLPKAHVEAPVSGSMLLAGVLLKLGGYGLYRISLLLNLSLWSPYLISLGLLGGILASGMCFRQVDVKSLVAYSSVAHMGVFLGGWSTQGDLAWQGGVMLMVGHGFCSSGLFCLMNFYYERVGSRHLLILKGFLTFSPSLVFWSFLLLSSNMSAPPSLNLWGELCLFGSLWIYNSLIGVFLFLFFMLGGGYSLYLYSMLAHGKSWFFEGMKPINLREQLLMFLHWSILNMVFLCWSML